MKALQCIIDLLGLRGIISDVLEIFFDLTLKPLIKYQNVLIPAPAK